MNRMHGIIFSFEKPTGLGKLTEPRIHGSVPALLSIIFSFHVCSDLCSEPVSCVGNKFAPPVRVKYLFHNRP